MSDEKSSTSAPMVIESSAMVESLDIDDETETVVLIAKDGKKFEIRKKACLISKFCTNIFEDKTCKEITFDKVDSASLDAVCRWMEYHSKVVPRVIEKPLRSANMADLVDEWDAKFVEVDQDTMFNIMLVANYMTIEPLLMLMCAKCASMLKGRTPAEIRKTFNIRDDYTPEEEEQVRKEHADLLNWVIDTEIILNQCGLKYCHFRIAQIVW